MFAFNIIYISFIQFHRRNNKISFLNCSSWPKFWILLRVMHYPWRWAICSLTSDPRWLWRLLILLPALMINLFFLLASLSLMLSPVVHQSNLQFRWTQNYLYICNVSKNIHYMLALSHFFSFTSNNLYGFNDNSYTDCGGLFIQH